MTLAYRELSMSRATEYLAVLQGEMESLKLGAPLGKLLETVREIGSNYERYSIPVPTGAVPATDEDIERARRFVLSVAERCGYPDVPTEAQKTRFDDECSSELWANLGISLSTAGHFEQWLYLSCVVVPDVIAWRWGTRNSADQRLDLVDSIRPRITERRRNMLRHLWLRGYLVEVGCLNGDDMRAVMKEDVYRQVMERASLIERPALAVRSIDNYINYPEGRARARLVYRRALRHITLELATVSVDYLTDEDLEAIVDEAFLASVVSSEVDAPVERGLDLVSAGSDPSAFGERRQVGEGDGEAEVHAPVSSTAAAVEFMIIPLYVTGLHGRQSLPPKSGLNASDRGINAGFLPVPLSMNLVAQRMFGEGRFSLVIGSESEAIECEYVSRGIRPVVPTGAMRDYVARMVGVQGSRPITYRDLSSASIYHAEFCRTPDGFRMRLVR